MNDPIGFIGLGNMGGPMAGRLLQAGHRLVVFDIRDDAVSALTKQGAVAAASPAAVAAQVEIVLTSLPTPDVAKRVNLGPDGLVAGDSLRTVIELSTIGPETAKEIAAGLAVRGIDFVDSPVSGGIAGAQKGTLAVMTSCSAKLMEKIRPMLSVFGNVFHVGAEPGLGQTMKLANNMLGAAALALTSEAMVMGAKAGLDPKIMLEVINAGSGRNSATQDKFPKAVLTRSFDFGFANGLMQKDVSLYLKEAEALGVPTELAAAVGQLWQIVCAEIGPDADFTTIVQCVERRAGVEVKSV